MVTVLASRSLSVTAVPLQRQVSVKPVSLTKIIRYQYEYLIMYLCSAYVYNIYETAAL